MTNNYGTPTFDALVELTRSIRPAWDTPGIRAAVRDALNRDIQPSLAELAYALVRCAENPGIRSPGVIALNGPHWRMQTTEPEPTTRLFRCPRCGRIDHNPGDNCHPPPVTLADYHAHIATVRAAHADARSRRIDADAARREAREGTKERLAAAEGTTPPPEDAEALDANTVPARERIHNR